MIDINTPEHKLSIVVVACNDDPVGGFMHMMQNHFALNHRCINA